MAIKRADIRKILGEDAEDKVISEILDLVHEETDDLKEQISTLETEKATAVTEKEKAERDYNDLKTAHDREATREKVREAYKQLLKDAKIKGDLIELVLSASESKLDSIELNQDGTLKNASKLTEGIKNDYSKYIVTEKEHGADVDNPPGGAGGSKTFDKMSLDEKMAYANAHPNDAAVTAWLNS